MASRFSLSTVAVAGLFAGAMTISTVFSGAASANADANGVDIFVWQKTPGLTSERPAEDFAFYFNRVAFNYASTTDSEQ